MIFVCGVCREYILILFLRRISSIFCVINIHWYKRTGFRNKFGETKIHRY